MHKHLPSGFKTSPAQPPPVLYHSLWCFSWLCRYRPPNEPHFLQRICYVVDAEFRTGVLKKGRGFIFLVTEQYSQPHPLLSGLLGKAQNSGCKRRATWAVASHLGCGFPDADGPKRFSPGTAHRLPTLCICQATRACQSQQVNPSRSMCGAHIETQHSGGFL